MHFNPFGSPQKRQPPKMDHYTINAGHPKDFAEFAAFAANCSSYPPL